MTKKIYLSLLLVAVLNGCGSGGTTTDTTTVVQDVTSDTTDTTVSLATISKTPIPYEDAEVLDNVTKQAYLDAINEARSKQQDCGTDPETGEVYGLVGPADPLVWNDNLYKAAYEHTNDLVENNTFSHDGSNTSSDWTAVVQELGRGSQVHERIANNGYSIKEIGENITAGTYRDTPEEAVQAWLDSPGHCVNLMNSEYMEMGMAYIMKEGTTYVHYWTQNLGKPQ